MTTVQFIYLQEKKNCKNLAETKPLKRGINIKKTNPHFMHGRKKLAFFSTLLPNHFVFTFTRMSKFSIFAAIIEVSSEGLTTIA